MVQNKVTVFRFFQSKWCYLKVYTAELSAI